MTFNERTIIEFNNESYYVLAELKSDTYHFVELMNIVSSDIIFAACNGNVVVPITDSELIDRLQENMSKNAMINAEILKRKVKK